jgi:hypothetical protein
MVNKVICEEYCYVVGNFVKSDTGIMHEDGSAGIEELNDGIKQVFVPLMTCR